MGFRGYVKTKNKIVESAPPCPGIANAKLCKTTHCVLQKCGDYPHIAGGPASRGCPSFLGEKVKSVVPSSSQWQSLCIWDEYLGWGLPRRVCCRCDSAGGNV